MKLDFLLTGVRSIEEGNFNTRVPILSHDEIGSFAQSLNKMAKSLKASQEELESRVAERTAELQTSLVRLKATQAQLIQSEKMASMGELTAGIAHEIQNPLNFVNNFSEVNAELIEELEQENHHGKRADAIVKGMLQHSRASTGIKEPTDINKLADEYLRLSYHGIRVKDKDFNATMETAFDKSIGKINVVPQDIGRVLLNLFNNAFYSVIEKKKLQGESYDPELTQKRKMTRLLLLFVITVQVFPKQW